MRYGLRKGGWGGCTIVTVYMNPCHCVQCESETKHRQRPLGCSLAELVQVLDASKMFFSLITCNRMRPAALCLKSTKKGSYSALKRHPRNTTIETPITYANSKGVQHASKLYKVHKLHQRYILLEDCRRFRSLLLCSIFMSCLLIAN